MIHPRPPEQVVHRSRLLWKKQAQLFGQSWPAGVVAVRCPIPGTAFFPGGWGLIHPHGGERLPDFPVGGVMVLGHDFHSEEGYQRALDQGHESMRLPTWAGLQCLLRDARIPSELCFFTNFFMGLREGTNTMGVFPGARDPEFVQACLGFLEQQLLEQKPRLVLVLGGQVPRLVAKLAPSRLGAWQNARTLTQLDPINAVVREVCLTPSAPDFHTQLVALVHPSMRRSNVWRRRYGALSGHPAELAMIAAASNDEWGTPEAPSPTS